MAATTDRNGGRQTRPDVAERWPVRLALAVALPALALVAALSVLPPQAAPASVSEDTFSAARAMRHLQIVAAEPHPIGSPAQQRVRDHLVAAGEALGLPTEVQRDDARGGANVIVRLPGAADSPRDVLITAHYDSAPATPGAADNGMAVAAMLETMRALRSGEPLANDIVFLFTDGEERGQTGIAAFVRQHRAADRVGVAFAFEGLPQSSGTELRATTPGDAWLIPQLAEAAPPMFANSALNTTARDRAGNDFEAFAPAGIVAAEFLTEGNVVRYHNARDNIAAIDEGVVQDHGDTMLALARHFGRLDLTTARTTEDDAVFFTAPRLGLVFYPVWVARLLALTALAALIVTVVVARRRKRLRGAHLAWATLIIALTIIVHTALAWAAWDALLDMNPESAWTLQFPDFEGSTTAMAAIYALAAVVFVAACHWLSRRITAIELAAGTAVWWALVTLALSIAVPLFSPVALWPLVGGVAGLGALSTVRRPWLRAGLLALAAVPGLVVVVPLLALEALRVEQGPLVALPLLLLLLGSLLPQLLLITGGVRPQVGQGATSARPRPRAAPPTPMRPQRVGAQGS